MLHKRGESVEEYEGEKSMQACSKYIEERFEQIKLGSRPRNGLI